ncbi:MAG: glycosyltransferase family 4 protein [Micrococcaceae bacterium]
MSRTSPLRLFIDARYTRTDFHDGISRYGASLIEATARRADVTMIIHDEAQLPMLPPGVPWVKVTAPTSPREPLVARELNQYAPDVVFSPMQTMGSAGRRFGLILTLHDLIYYQHRTPPRDFPLPVRGLWRLYHLAYWPQRLLLDRADEVVTVSGTTQRLMRHHRLTRRPITVVSNAPQPTAAPRDPERSPEKTLVYMGSFMDYKNVESLIAALPGLPGYQLHLLSRISSAREEELRRQAAELGLDPNVVVFHRGTSEEEYRELLRSCTALVTMSRAEGFGLPLAEAMAEGTPVIVSDLEIFREIGGEAGAAQFVELTDPEATGSAVAAAVRRWEDPVAYAEASRAASQQAQRFTWERSAEALMGVAESVVDRRRRRAQQR